MYRFDPLVNAYDSIGVIGTSTSLGVSTRVERLNLSAEAESRECQIYDFGKYQGVWPRTDVQFLIVMSQAGAELPQNFLNELKQSGTLYTIENIKDHPSFSAAHEEYLSTNTALLVELEKLLDVDNPIRIQRENYRAQLTKSVQMPEFRSVLVDGEVQELVS